MEGKPRLELGEPPKGLKIKTTGSTRLLLAAVLLLQVGIAAILLLRGPAAASSGGAGKEAGGGGPEALKATALALEEKSLSGPAAEAWDRYLAAADNDPDRPEILYRAGRLFMDAGRFEEAAACFVRAELAAKNDAALDRKIGPRMVECLRRLGLHGEMSRELSRRVEEGAGEVGRGKILALLDGEPLREADLDRMIERRVDQMLALGDTAGDGDGRARERLLAQLQEPEARKRLFQDLLRTELFSRRARELGMDREESFRSARDFLEENLLANRLLAKELEKARPTQTDLESYYAAHKEAYKEPEGVEAYVLPLSDGEDFDALLKKITSAAEFKDRVAERAGLEQGKDPVPFEIRKGIPHPLLGADTEVLFDMEPGTWTRTPLENGKKRFLVLVNRKLPERIPSLAEVKDRVAEAYRSRKEQELVEALFQDLMARYDVKILAEPGAPAASAAPGDEKAGAPAEKKDPGGEKDNTVSQDGKEGT